MQPGLFITVDGVDGAGKTTQLGVLAEWLADRGAEVVCTREPGGTPFGEAVRELLIGAADTPMDEQTELMLIFCARMQHIAEVIRPALAAGRCVLCDRFTDATYAYQGGGRGIDRARIAALEEWVQQGLEPDLTLLFDLPEEVGAERARQRGGQDDRFERQGSAFRSAVREAYRDQARRFPERVRMIDATGSVEAVSERVFAVLEPVLASRCGGAS